MASGAGLPTGLGPTFWSTWSATAAGAGATHALGAEQLGEGEAWIGGWDGVGLYEGNNKVPAYQNMTVHITTHRLLLVPDSGPALQAPLSAVRQTEFYAGFMRSSAKITLSLGWTASENSAASLDIARTDSPAPISPAVSVAPPRISTPASEPAPQSSTWTCGVCGFGNPLAHGTIIAPSSKCQLCGVAYAMSRTMSPPPSRPASAAPTLASAASIPRTGTPASTMSLPIPSPASAAPSPITLTATETPTTDTSDQIPCPACTFLNHASMTTCEICGTALPRLRKRDRKPSTSDTRERSLSVNTSATMKKEDTVRLSFRKGGEREAYKRLKGVLSDKVWERVAKEAAPKPRVERAGGGGIDAIMKNISLNAKAHDEGMQDAFRDLEVLMVRAGEMVRLAQSLNAKLSAAGSSGTSDEEATLVRSSLVQLGLPAPALTQDMVRDERAYLDGLARELGSLLTGSAGNREGLMMQPGQGVVALDNVWGLWMRARGVALLPPSVMISLLPLLPGHTHPPIRALSLPSGLQVLHSPLYAPGTLAQRLVHRLQPDEAAPAPEGEDQGGAEEEISGKDEEAGMSIIDIAAVEGLPIGLATELIDLVSSANMATMGIVRDEQAGASDGGVRFYRDIIKEWPLGLVQ